MGKLKNFEVLFDQIRNKRIKLTKLALTKPNIKNIIDDIAKLNYTKEELEETRVMFVNILDRTISEHKDTEEIKNYFKSNINFRNVDTLKEWMNRLFNKLINNEYVVATYRDNEYKRKEDYKLILKGFRLIAEILEDVELEPIQMIDVLSTIANLGGVCVSGWKEAVVEILVRFEKNAIEKTKSKDLIEYEPDAMKRVLEKTFWDARVSVAKELGYNYMNERDISVSYRPHYMEVFYRYLNKVHKLNLPLMDLKDKLLSGSEKIKISMSFGMDNLAKNISIEDMIYDRAVSTFMDELKEEGNLYEILSDWGSSYFRKNKLEEILVDNVEFLTEYILSEDMTTIRNIAIREIMKDYGYIYEKNINKVFGKINEDIYQNRLMNALNDIKTDAEREGLRQYILNNKTDLQNFVDGAIEMGYYKIFKDIKDVNLDRMKIKAWFMAIRRGNIKDIRSMLETGIDIDTMTTNKSTALYLACKHGRYDIAKFLIQNGAQVNIECQYKRTPLYIASKNGRYDIVELLLENQAKILLKKASFININLNLNEILYMACARRYIQLIHQLIDHKVNLNQQVYFWERKTVLHKVVERQDLEIADILVKGGANVNIQDNNWQTPLNIACEKNDLEMVKYLVEKGASINIKNREGELPLHIAARNDNVDMVKYLTSMYTKVNEKDEQGRTPLYFACENGNLNMVRVLLNKKARVNINTRNGVTPIYAATYNGYSDIVKLLLKKGADLKNKYNETILWRACKNRDIEIAKALQKNGATAKNMATEILAYCAAVEYKDKEILNILISAGVDLNIKNVYGYTALYKVCANRDIEMLDILLQDGSKINVDIKCGKRRNTALDVAYKNGYNEIVERLKEYQENQRLGIRKDTQDKNNIGRFLS